jgi:hypothetical protein
MSDMEKVLAGVDASRRAGWAHYYAELQSNDQLSRDLNVAQDERNIMRRALSRMAGFMEVYASAAGPEARHAINAMLDGLGAVTDAVHVTEGRAIANELLRQEKTSKQETELLAKKKRIRQHDHLVKKFYDDLAKRYGFASRRDLKCVLDHVLLNHELSEWFASEYQLEIDALVCALKDAP